MLRLLGISIVICLSIGCSIAPVKSTETNDYIGKSFYLLRPPRMILQENGKFPVGGQTKLNRCEPFEVLSVLNASGDFGFELKQKSNVYKMVFSKTNMTNGALTTAVNPISQFLEIHLSKTWPFKDNKLTGKIGDIKSKSDLCDDNVWIGMTKDQLMFKIGPPATINRTVGPTGKTEQYVYGGYGSSSAIDTMAYGQSKTKYFYFQNGLLTSMQD